MNNSISLVSLFWHDGHENSTRVRNIEYTWKELKRLSNFLKQNNINAVHNLYDFSHTKIVDDSIHIPYPVGEYKLSEKRNIILKQQLQHKYVLMVDCDVFFHPEDYTKLLYIITSLQKGDLVTFDLAKLCDDTYNYIIDNVFYKDKADWSYAYAGNRDNGPLGGGHVGGLGGTFIADIPLLLEIGGFDETYTGWGGEDGDIIYRLVVEQKHHTIRSTRDFAPYHLPHLSDWSNPEYSNRFKSID